MVDLFVHKFVEFEMHNKATSFLSNKLSCNLTLQ